MRRIALKMLFGDSAKFYGILLGLTFATLLITQQSAIFVGLMTRTYALIEEIPQADLWVADPTLQFVDDTKPMAVTALDRVRTRTGLPSGAGSAPFAAQLFCSQAGGLPFFTYNSPSSIATQNLLYFY